MFLLIRAKFFILPALVMWGVTHCQFLNDVQFQKLAGKWMSRDMVETAGVTQDLEWQVQADLAEEEEEEEVEVEVDEEVKEEEEEDTEEANKEEGGDDSPLILRHPRRHTGHVTFGHNDIRPISTNLAPFSYLTLFCPIVNEISGPKRVTHHIFYSVQKIAVVQTKKES